MQLVTVRWGYCPAKARLMLLRCAVLYHHVSDSSLVSLTLPTGPIPTSVISHLLLLLNASTPSTALDASVISDKGRIEVTGASVPTLWAGLLQRYTIALTADIVIKRLQSVQNSAARLVSRTIFRGHYHYFTQPLVTCDVAKNRFQEHNPVSMSI